jgi:hypothetical protein
MSKKKLLVLFGILVMAAVLLSACAGTEGPQGPAGDPGPAGPQGEQGPAGESANIGDLTCTECHNDTTLIGGRAAEWAESVHGTGEAYVRGTSASCAGCHSGGAFSAMVAAGGNPGAVEAGDPHPTRQDCRACHQIHTTYTGEDWALETTDAVALYAVPDVTFEGGEGNLCVNCHQPRRVFPEPTADGLIEGISSHWGPHHGPQSAMLLGLAGAGDVEGSASPHARVENTCVGCHLVDQDHSFEPNVAACAECHGEIEDFDIDGLQTQVQGLLDELGAMLVDLGLLDPTGDHPAVTSAPLDQATALWNWIYIAHEDKSLGVHNPSYTVDLLEYSIALLAGE